MTNPPVLSPRAPPATILSATVCMERCGASGVNVARPPAVDSWSGCCEAGRACRGEGTRVSDVGDHVAMTGDPALPGAFRRQCMTRPRQRQARPRARDTR